MEASGATDLQQSVREFASRSRQKGLTVVISDFLDPQGVDAGLKILRTLGHDVLVVHVTSERDRDPGGLGEVQFVDTETGERREIDVTPQLAAAYVQAWNAHADRARTVLWTVRHRLPAGGCGTTVRGDRPQGVPPGTIRRLTSMRLQPEIRRPGRD